MPDGWRAQATQGEESVEDLSDRLHLVCTRIQKGRFPFQGRIPFPCYVEEYYDTPVIRRHTFYGRPSLARELMYDDYARSCARDPHIAWRASVYVRVSRALRELAEPVHGRTRRYPLWRVPGAPNLRLAPDPDELIALLRATEPRTVENLVARALELVGAITQDRLVDLLLLVLPEPPSTPPHDDLLAFEAGEGDAAIPITVRRSPDPYLLGRVREALLDAWERLDPQERRLLGWIGRGLTYDEIIARNAEYRDPPTLSAHLASINVRVVERLALVLGAPPKRLRGQRDLAELIYDALSPCLPGEEEP
jgi:hypothetical protein